MNVESDIDTRLFMHGKNSNHIREGVHIYQNDLDPLTPAPLVEVHSYTQGR